MNGGPQALATSLLLARMSGATQPLQEQHLLERLRGAAAATGCQSQDLATAIYVGLKLHWSVLLCGPARDRAMRCLDALVGTVVGPGSGQTLHIHGPIGSNPMAQRFAAVRLGDFVATALEPAEQSKAWFVLVDSPGEPTATLRWVEREVLATLRAHGRAGRDLPSNVFVLGAAGTAPSMPPRYWLPLQAPVWGDASVGQGQQTPPVGYQRRLLQSQLTRARYRAWLQDNGAWRQAISLARTRNLDARRVARWLAASVDEWQQGLWVQADAGANTRKAVSVLETHGQLARGVGSPVFAQS